MGYLRFTTIYLILFNQSAISGTNFSRTSWIILSVRGELSDCHLPAIYLHNEDGPVAEDRLDKAFVRQKNPPINWDGFPFSLFDFDILNAILP